MANHDLSTLPVLTGYADSVNAAGRIGSGAFALPPVDVGAYYAENDDGLGATDTVGATKGIGLIPQNTAVRRFAVQVLKPLKNAAGTTVASVPITVKAGTASLGTATIETADNVVGGTVFVDVTLANGTVGDEGPAKVSLTLGTLDPVSDLVSGCLGFIFYADYAPEVDEVTALGEDIGDAFASFGGNKTPAYTDSRPNAGA